MIKAFERYIPLKKSLNDDENGQNSVDAGVQLQLGQERWGHGAAWHYTGRTNNRVYKQFNLQLYYNNHFLLIEPIVLIERLLITCSAKCSLLNWLVIIAVVWLTMVKSIHTCPIWYPVVEYRYVNLLKYCTWVQIHGTDLSVCIFLLLRTSIPVHLRGKYCITSYSIKYIWQLYLVASFQMTFFIPFLSSESMYLFKCLR